MMITIHPADPPAPKSWRLPRAAMDVAIIVLLFGAMLSARAMFLASAAALLALVLYAWLVMSSPARERFVILGVAAAITGAVAAILVAIRS